MVVRVIRTKDEDYIVDFKKGKKYYQFKFYNYRALSDFVEGLLNSEYNFKYKISLYMHLIDRALNNALFDTDTVFIEMRRNKIDILYFVKDNMLNIYFMV